MDVDEPEAPNGCSSELKVNGLLLHPVLPQDEGEGLPYAPINWPNPGDTWGWRVGKRTAISGYYLDRYLYLPSRLQKSRRGRDGFASKLSVEQYIQARFPGADIEAFFASFSWKIPSKQTFLVKDHNDSSCMLSEELAEASLSDCQNGGPACKAGSSLCPSLTEEEKVSSVSTTMFCDICCSEPSFCRECCCILCCKTIDFAFGGYSFIRCQAKANDGLICGHAAHLVCALRCYMAGTVPGKIALDAEYYCRRCDLRTELVEHVTKVFKICESVDSREDNKKMLNLVICLLRGSQRRDVKRLLNRAQLVLQKFESGNVSDIWILEDDISSVKKGMKSDFLLKRAKKITSGSKPPAKVVEDQGVPEQVPAPSIDAVVATPTLNVTTTSETTLVLSPSSSIEAGTQGSKGDDPPQIDRGKKRPRPVISVDPTASVATGRSAFAAPVPSVVDMQNLAPPDHACVREREWLTSLSPRALQLEGMKYAEMARLSMLASTTVCNALDVKCKKIRDKCAAKLAKMNATVMKLEEERSTLVEEKAKLAEERSKFVEENMLVKTNAENLQRAISTKDCEMVELKKERDDWRVRAERAVSDYIKSDDYMMKLADEVGPHWEQGIRIGVRQVVARFGEFDPSITYFTPDYTDLFGEPPIEDPVEGDSQAANADLTVATTSATSPEDREAS